MITFRKQNLTKYKLIQFKASWKKCFLSKGLNDSIEEQLRMNWGSRFHMRGAATERARSPHDRDDLG